MVRQTILFSPVGLNANNLIFLQAFQLKIMSLKVAVLFILWKKKKMA